MKLSENDIMEIKRLFNEGRRIEFIANKYNVSVATIEYWCNKYNLSYIRVKQKKINNEKYKLGIHNTQLNPEHTREYLKSYINRRYHADPAFKDRMIKSMIKYNNKIKERNRIQKEQDRIDSYTIHLITI